MNCGANIHDDARKHYEKEHYGIQTHYNEHDKYQFDAQREYLKESHPQYSAEALRAAGDCPDDLAGLAGEVEGEGLVLNVGVDQVSDVDLGRGTHIGKGDFSDVVHEVCCETNRTIHCNQEVSLIPVWAVFVILTHLDIVNGVLQYQGVCDVESLR